MCGVCDVCVCVSVCVWCVCVVYVWCVCCGSQQSGKQLPSFGKGRISNGLLRQPVMAKISPK